MTERKKPSGFGRGVAVLAIVALGAMAVTPAFSAFNATKGKIKKIAKKQVKQVGGNLFIEEGAEVGVIAPTTSSKTDGDKTLLQKGPFKVTMDCSDDSGDSNLQLNVSTTEASTHVSENWTGGAQLDPADGEYEFFNDTGNPQPGDSASEYNPYYGALFLTAPSGTRIYAVFNGITDFGGAACFVNGWYYDLTA